jgi:DNA-binding response OmpR family regulator
MRLLIVEDEPALAELLHLALERAGFAGDVARGIVEAAEHLRLAAYDALILDLGLADGDGLTFLRGLRRRSSPLPVLVLTARDAPEDRVAGLDSGADDYVIKPFHMDELVSRIRALLRRPNTVLGVDLGLGNLVLRTTARTVAVDGQPVALSLRETSLLELLLRRQGGVVTREAIEAGLYDFDNPTTPNAIEVLVHRLRRRLQDAGATVVIHTIRGVGYLLAAAEA